MYLKSLTLRGFKSFASATTLVFEPGITCVVGPNGSGKSNVVDALSWVMGEQGAKTLRGGKMEDVIFAGTSGRAPLGRAEVSLTIDNTDGALPVEYTEVTISRTMFRTGGSEYSINGHAARLLDVQELLSDSGIGREMHVIVGQGQLDAILGATPEVRRGFIEEAAGVLKHRKRKEKALRKLESTQTNLDRLQDLVAEIRRQLKPLGRQAEVARKAALIQAERRDALARVLADDLTRATLALEADLADEAAMNAARERAERALEDARAAEARAEQALAASAPRLNSAQDSWYALAALRERLTTTISVSAERMRHADAQPELDRGGRDPQALEREAEEARAHERELSAEVDRLTEALRQASAARAEAEEAHAAADAEYATRLRAAADRREGLARLRGQVGSLDSRLAAASEEAERLRRRLTEAQARAGEAELAFTKLEQSLAGLDAGESGLDAAYEAAEARVVALDAELATLRRRETDAAQRRASQLARRDALALALERRDGAAALLDAHDAPAGVLGSLSTLLEVEPGWEAALAAALGPVAEAVATADQEVALAALRHLRVGDHGRAVLLVGSSDPAPDPTPVAPPGAVAALDTVSCEGPLRAALAQALGRVVFVDSLEQAHATVSRHDGLTAVTRGGDVLSRWMAVGGSAGAQSAIEIQAAVDAAAAEAAEAEHDLERVRFALAEHQRLRDEAQASADAALERLHESDAELAAISEELGQLAQRARSARDEGARLQKSLDEADRTRERDERTRAELAERLERASDDSDTEEPDPEQRDRLAVLARQARQADMDARLALRTAEERVRSMGGRADSLRRAAIAERQSREKAVARAAQLRREGQAAQSVHTAAVWLMGVVDWSRALAGQERAAAEDDRRRAEEALQAARREVRDRSQEVQRLLEGAHRDELARIEQRMRIEQLGERALSDLGIEPEALMAEYGPDTFVPVLTTAGGDPLGDGEPPASVPYVREQQLKRLQAAERNLQVLGRVNPLALEEFDAMQERHQFLAEQLDDLRRTRKDLLDIVTEVDQRVEQVFASAYADVATAFESVFSRLFPGGEGRLVLTEPGAWLSTGVDVEARPAGKKVKRLSLLSGGERSLVAVAFLVSLFIARPSPFYILDEVEAALDDTNLGRLLSIYEELRENSQLLVITHQKRTMEIADALYGVTMRGDGVSTVISQRLRDR
ncbi:MAG TPA: chromosome segregation protein SMC [Propionibacteriaceae bacterium]|nr:chromosome segregation protein SMC [Propionibacteriaceae bacterium]